MSTRRESPERTLPEAKAPWGTAACVLGMVCAASGVFFVDFVFEFLGILLGATSYALGARRLGIATVVLSTVLLLVFMAVIQGVIPGIEPRDPLAL